MISLFRIKLLDFSELDKQIEKFKELRDSYKAANIAHFGEYLARLLDE